MLDKFSTFEINFKLGIVHFLGSSSLSLLEIPMVMILSITPFYIQGWENYLSLHNRNHFSGLGMQSIQCKDNVCAHHIPYCQAWIKPFFCGGKFVFLLFCFSRTMYHLFMHLILLFTTCTTFSLHQYLPFQYLFSDLLVTLQFSNLSLYISSLLA